MYCEKKIFASNDFDLRRKFSIFEYIHDENSYIEDISELEIAVGHWPFSDQFQELADQN